MQNQEKHFGDVFKQILGNYTPGKLAEITGIPKQTLVSWKEGRVKRPRNEVEILKVASALRCDQQEVNQLLNAAGYLEFSGAKVEQWIQQARDALTSAMIGEIRAARQTEIDLLANLKRRLQVTPNETATQAASPIALPVRLSNAHYLPARPYRTLIGRERLVQEVLTALQDGEGRHIVALDGHGGIGKTSIAYEVATQAIQHRLFDDLVWLRAPKRDPHRPAQAEQDLLTYESVLNAITNQLGRSELSKLVAVEKEVQIRLLLQQRRILLVLDNLETAGEPQNEIAARLLSLLTTSKALLTSRHRFQGDLYVVHLDGILENAALDFLLQEATEKGIRRLINANRAELQPIVQTTGGSPLAMKLVVGQLGHLPLEIVLERLRSIHLLNNDNKRDEYSRLYKFIFLPSWQLLSLDGKKLLLSLAHFAPGIGGVYAAIQATSDLPATILAQAIDELWQLSFVEIGQSSHLQQVRYYLHALTQYFVLSDIVQQIK